jgi:hypothetical protein
MEKFIWVITVFFPTAVALTQIAERGSINLGLQIAILIMFFYGTVIQLIGTLLKK